MSYYEYHSNISAPCGIGKCKKRFHSEIEWAYHVKEKHKTFFKKNQMARKFDIEDSTDESQQKGDKKNV